MLRETSERQSLMTLKDCVNLRMDEIKLDRIWTRGSRGSEPCGELASKRMGSPYELTGVRVKRQELEGKCNLLTSLIGIRSTDSTLFKY